MSGYFHAKNSVLLVMSNSDSSILYISMSWNKQNVIKYIRTGVCLYFIITQRLTDLFSKWEMSKYLYGLHIVVVGVCACVWYVCKRIHDTGFIPGEGQFLFEKVTFSDPREIEVPVMILVTYVINILGKLLHLFVVGNLQLFLLTVLLDGLSLETNWEEF